MLEHLRESFSLSQGEPTLYWFLLIHYKNESDTAYLKEWLKTAVSNTTKCRLNISDGI
ncbi:TPA: hypothetical protein WHP07_000182 [Neisseria meningitidis]